MRSSAERAYHLVCLALGRVMRSARYATTRIVQQDGARRVRKKRDRHAPFLVAMGAPLSRILDSGVHVLSQRDWIERERALHHTLRGAVVEAHDDGSLILPCLPGVTLSVMLEDPALGDSDRRRAIVLAVAALVAFHQRGLTHADAMAEKLNSLL